MSRHGTSALAPSPGQTEGGDRRIRRAAAGDPALPAVAASPAIAAAQRAVFVEGLSELTDAVAGTYGDEGARVGPALDKMAGGLAEWDRAIRAFESRLASELPGASPRAAFQMREALARMYVERGRLADAVRELDAASRLEPQRADVHVLRGLVLDASARSTDAGEAFRSAWALDASDPITAYHVFRHAATAGNTKEMQGARETLAAAYLRLLQDGARAKAFPFVGIELLQDSAASAPVLSPVAYAPGLRATSRTESTTRRSPNSEGPRRSIPWSPIRRHDRRR